MRVGVKWVVFDVFALTPSLCICVVDGGRAVRRVHNDSMRMCDVRGCGKGQEGYIHREFYVATMLIVMPVTQTWSTQQKVTNTSPVRIRTHTLII